MVEFIHPEETLLDEILGLMTPILFFKTSSDYLS